MRFIKLAMVSALALVTGCVPMATATHGSAAMSYSSAVVINGVELTPAQQDEFAMLVGDRLPPGRYYVTADGMMGREGEAPRVNLAAVIEARRGQQQQHAARGSIHNSSGDSHITSDGNGCTILSTPSGSLSSGC